MPNLIEDRLTSLLAGWIDAHRPEGFPSDLPVHVANRDELRSRPCVVLNASESKPVPALPHTARVKLDVHLFSQVDDTPAETHAAWAGVLVSLLQGKAALRAALNSDTFILHDLLARDSATTPDEARGRETALGYEAVVSAVTPVDTAPPAWLQLPLARLASGAFPPTRPASFFTTTRTNTPIRRRRR